VFRRPGCRMAHSRPPAGTSQRLAGGTSLSLADDSSGNLPGSFPSRVQPPARGNHRRSARRIVVPPPQGRWPSRSAGSRISLTTDRRVLRCRPGRRSDHPTPDRRQRGGGVGHGGTHNVASPVVAQNSSQRAVPASGMQADPGPVMSSQSRLRSQGAQLPCPLAKQELVPLMVPRQKQPGLPLHGPESAAQLLSPAAQVPCPGAGRHFTLRQFLVQHCPSRLHAFPSARQPAPSSSDRRRRGRARRAPHRQPPSSPRGGRQ
jgi:hypothetical protein